VGNFEKDAVGELDLATTDLGHRAVISRGGHRREPANPGARVSRQRSSA
jgi:hypothetical protein